MKMKDLSALLVFIGSTSVFAGNWVCSVSQEGHNRQAVEPVIIAGAEVPIIPFQYNGHEIVVQFNKGDQFEPQQLLWLAIDGISSMTYNPSEKSLYSLTLKDGTSLQCHFVADARAAELPPAKIKNPADLERLEREIKGCDRDIRRRPNNALTHGAKAKALVKLADLKQDNTILLQALECFSTAIGFEEFNAGLLVARAELYLRLGDKEAASRDVEKAEGMDADEGCMGISIKFKIEDIKKNL